MKVIAYHIDPKEKELLILANYKKHDITIIANSLTLNTLSFAAGKQVLIAFNEDSIDAPIIERLRSLGIRYIVSYSFNSSHIDLLAAKRAGLEVASFPFGNCVDLANMRQIIATIDYWAAEYKR